MSQPQPKYSIKNFTSHPRFNHFLVYSLSCVILGQVITSIGPLFPYLAVHQNRLQTQYSVLFVFRGIGYISGSLLLKIFSGRLTLHQFIGLGIGVMGISSILFNFSEDLYFKGFCMLGSSIGCSFQTVAINIAALDCFTGDNVLVWLQSIHGFFGVGGLVGPYVVYLFELSSLTFLGVLAIISTIFYYHLQTPQTLINLQNLQKQDKKIAPLPSLSLYLLSAGFLLIIGQEVSYGGWISSYAVLYNFSTKQHATIYSSTYWISITVFRFVLSAVGGSATGKIRGLAATGIFTSFFSVFVVFWVDSELGLMLMSILYGLTSSGLFSLMLTVPEEFGYKLTMQQTTVFTIWSAIGQGCLGIGIGKMMEWFSYNWLIYGMCLINILILTLIQINKKILQNQPHQTNPNTSQLLLNPTQPFPNDIQLKQIA